MIHKKSIGIVGCGWLGKPLYDFLSSIYNVECYSRDSTKDDSLFWQRDIIIIAINTKDNYLQTLKKIAKLTAKSSTTVLMSSISVYREFDSEVDENTHITKSSLQRDAELLMQEMRESLVVLRLGGLMGEDRISGRWKGASVFSDGEVNYIHRDDVIDITQKILETNIKSGIYNLVAPLHPLRSQVHKRNSEIFDFEIATFEGRTHRIVSSDAIIKKLDYTFVHPNPLEFWS
nr:hypothetical protein [uncultured Sulfurimonas sp.]